MTHVYVIETFTNDFVLCGLNEEYIRDVSMLAVCDSLEKAKELAKKFDDLGIDALIAIGGDLKWFPF